jgi:hypothetical protein
MGRSQMLASAHPLTFNVSGHFGATGEQLWDANGGVGGYFPNSRYLRLKTAASAPTISTRGQRVLISGMIRSFPIFGFLDFREISINLENL